MVLRALSQSGAYTDAGRNFTLTPFTDPIYTAASPMNLWSIKGVIARHVGGDVTVQRVKSRIVESLAKEGVTAKEDGNAIVFENHRTFMWNFARYALVNGGRFHLKEQGQKISVGFDLSIRRLFLLSFVPTIFLSFFIFLAQNLSIAEKFLVAALFWLWFYGGNYIVLRIRNRRFLRRMLQP